VTAAAAAKPPAAAGPGMPCAAPHCPLLGTCSEGTRGAGRWLCRHHHLQPVFRWDEITLRLLDRQARGLPPDDLGPSQTVLQFRRRVEAALPSRVPGEDDEP
jgi:hypothetical protein